MSVSYNVASVASILGSGRDPLAANAIMQPGRHADCVLETVTATKSQNGSPILRLMFSRVPTGGEKQVVFVNLGYVPGNETDRKTGESYFTFTPTSLARFITASPQLVRALPMPSIDEFTADLADVDPADQEAWAAKFQSDLAQSRLSFFQSLVGATCTVVVTSATYNGQYRPNAVLASYAVASQPTA